NRNEPFLSQSPDLIPIDIPNSGILREKRYYFHVPSNDDGPYPIVPSFEHWIFPDEMPLPWRKVKISGPDDDEEGSSFSDEHDDDEPPANPEPISTDPTRSPPPAVFYHNESCRVSGSLIGLEIAHVIPGKEGSWFNKNYMREYCSSDAAHNDPHNDSPNLIPLAMAVHRFFDRSHLTWVVKPDGNPPPQAAGTQDASRHQSTRRRTIEPAQTNCVQTRQTRLQTANRRRTVTSEEASRSQTVEPQTSAQATDSYSLLIYVMRPPGKSDDGNLQMIMKYQDVEVYPLKGIPREYVFARFAWALFNDTIILFFNDKDVETMWLTLLLADDSTATGKPKWETTQLKGKFPRPRTGTRASQKGVKRRRSGDLDAVEGISDTYSCDSYDPETYDAIFDDIHSQYSSDSESSVLSYDSRLSKRSKSSHDKDVKKENGDCTETMWVRKPHNAGEDVQFVPELASSFGSSSSSNISSGFNVANRMTRTNGTGGKASYGGWKKYPVAY
ncbi:hypothetical protein F4781DRAFT_419199, partial [Annulohypoxylon bovei var. microspora]